MPHNSAAHKNGNTISYAAAIIAIVGLGVTMLMNLGGFATFRDYLPIREFNQYKESATAELKGHAAIVTEYREGLRRRVDRLEAFVERINDEQKKRAGNSERTNALEHRINALSARITETERKVTQGQPSIHDDLRRINTELQQLRGMLFSPKIRSNANE